MLGCKMPHNQNVRTGLSPDGRTYDGRFALSVREYAELFGISIGTAWKRVREGSVVSIQPSGKNGRVHIPVSAVAADLGIVLTGARSTASEDV